MIPDTLNQATSRTPREREAHADRVFAFTLAGAFLLLGLLARHRLRYSPATVSFVLALLFLFAGAIVPARLGPVRRAWMTIGEMIGRVTTPVFLGAVYYLILSPIAFLRRALRRGRSTRASGWFHRDPLPPAERMERQF